MARPSRLWTVIVGLFVVSNVGGAGFAIAMREPRHAVTHFGLVLIGYVVWRLISRPGRLDLASASETDRRLDHLQQSVDAIALEVERIGEAQRFVAQLEAQRAERVARQSLP
ncbi:MAG: hypothetical protein ACT4PJ_03815 [Gemmatimonadaceae bacterium]